MNIMITGAAGFVGQHLISRLSAHDQLFALVRERQSVSGDSVSNIVVDLAKKLDTGALPAAIDVIIHLAQANVLFPEAANELFAVNTMATQQLLDYGRTAGARQFILASTGDVYGTWSGLSSETDPAQPANYYGATKYAAELVARAYASYLNPCILRLYQPYGPGQSNRLIPKLADRIHERKAVHLHRDGHPHLTPTYIDDVTCAIERAIETSYCGTLNIAGDDILSVRELAEEIGRALKTEPLFEETDEKAADVMGNNKLMKQVLGSWDLTSLKEGVSRTFNGEEVARWRKV